jgi:hypothetical protein
VPAKVAPTPPDRTRPQLDDFKSRLNTAGFDPKIAAAASKIPRSLDREMASVSVERDIPPPGSYSPTRKRISMGSDVSKWDGRPELLHHEFGHHVHYAKGHITDTQVHPAIKAAMEADVKAFRNEIKDSVHDWKWNRRDKVLGILGINDRAPLDLEGESAVMRIADTLGALTKGKLGYGHSQKYYKTANNAAMEAYTNTFSAIVNEDPHFQRRFPNLVATVKGLLNL